MFNNTYLKDTNIVQKLSNKSAYFELTAFQSGKRTCDSALRN